MFTLLKTAHDKAEEYKGNRLVKLLTILFVIFLVLGIGVGYLTDYLTNKSLQTAEEKTTSQVKENFYEGKIVFVDPHFYPNDKVSFILENPKGEEIILLTADDQKLEVAEGHNARVYGIVVKTKDGKKDVLKVDKIAIKNAN